ncbi:glycosyltransferase 87 family protein [Alienimonas californiensis]|uniref:Polyprenol-phosphate-mannose-dependent alpha-(1-2)-phosphatidylinositol mannoside mannosyltransferase n=1 Tax=Alienimonas californiensis TaxID=2527989 RepID=A0A517P9E2_9PLAN|nr:glycosyltransferase 87 family protein [Alienimonas californiensis]QDT15996.1 hypothetical protein CA12_20940 [Alienimonas californiensis]
MWIAAAALLGAAAAAARDKPGDLPVYTRAAARAVAGGDFYDPADVPSFSYPPALVLAALPLLPLDDFGQRWAWWSLNLFLLGGILWTVKAAVTLALEVASETGESRTAEARRRVWAWGGLTALLAARFVLSPLQYQSHDLILLALLTAGAVWWTRGRDGAAGAACGLAAALKATPLLALPFFLLRRRWRAAAAMTAVGAATTILPDLLFRNPAGGPWVFTWIERFVRPVSAGVAPNVPGAWTRWNPLNQSLTGTLTRLTSAPTEAEHVPVQLILASPGVTRGLTLAAQAAVIAWLAWCGWRPRRDDRPAEPLAATVPPDVTATSDRLTPGLRCLAELSLVLCGMLLLSPMSSTQHFCLLLPGLAVVAARLIMTPRDKTNVLLTAVLLVLGPLPAKDVVGDYAAEVVRSGGGHTACTLLVLWATGRLLIRDRRAMARSVGEH